jgi:hypothetical protein
MRVGDAVVPRKQGCVHPLRLFDADQGDEAPPAGGHRSIAGGELLRGRASASARESGRDGARRQDKVEEKRVSTVKLVVNSRWLGEVHGGGDRRISSLVLRGGTAT